MTPSEIYENLRTFVVTELLDGDGEDLVGSTQLLETGIIDSFAVVDLVAHVEKRFGIRVPDEDVKPVNFGTLDALTGLVQRQLAAKETPATQALGAELQDG